MDISQIVGLAFIQGLTEFLPISSSAHLIFIPQLLGWEDQGLTFDVAVHFGTLLAVCMHFRKELWKLTKGLLAPTAPSYHAEHRLILLLVVATLPVGIAGLLLHDVVSAYARSTSLIATTTITFGVLLGWADWRCRGQKRIDTLGMKDALYIGFAQALALIPGTSRAGATMTMALLLGFSRKEAARFSFLLSIPTITLAMGYTSYKALSLTEINYALLCFGIFCSFITAHLTISLFLNWVERIGMLGFAVYRLLLGCFLLFCF